VIPEAACSAATFTSSGTRSTTCRESTAPTASKSCAGSTTAASWPRPGPISPLGSANGRPAIRG
jgi:hypothetical protein